MTLFVRSGRFVLVGALGTVVQLAALASLHHLLAIREVWASAEALELTLLHNFVWHRRWTWRDRGPRLPRLRALARFHLSGGLVSLLGTLTLEPLFLYRAHLPLLLSALLAILCCSGANFWLADVWAFTS